VLDRVVRVTCVGELLAISWGRAALPLLHGEASTRPRCKKGRLVRGTWAFRDGVRNAKREFWSPLRASLLRLRPDRDRRGSRHLQRYGTRAPSSSGFRAPRPSL